MTSIPLSVKINKINKFVEYSRNPEISILLNNNYNKVSKILIKESHSF